MQIKRRIQREMAPVFAKQEKKQCYFCTNGVKWIDYKDAALLRRFVSLQAKIYPTRKSGACAKHQRQLAQSVKRARYMALMPYTVSKTQNFPRA